MARGIVINRDSTDTTTVWNPSTSNKFHAVSFMGAASGSTAASVQTRMPMDFTIINLYVKRAGSASGGERATIRLNVAGVSTSLTANYAVALAPTVALVATSSGNVPNGQHTYKVTFVVNGIEQDAGTFSSILTNDGTHRQSTVSLDIGPTGTTARKIYRADANVSSTGPWGLIGTVSNNTAVSFTDSVATIGASQANTGLFGFASTLFTVAQDDLVCWEASDFVGLAAININYIVFTYERVNSSDGFVDFTLTSTAADTLHCLFAGGFGSGDFSATDKSDTYLPLAVALINGTACVPNTPTAGKSYTAQMEVGSPAVAVAPAVTIADANRSARAEGTGTLPATTAGAAADKNRIRMSISAAPASQTMFLGFQYRAPDPDRNVQIIAGGDPVSLNTLDGTRRFFSPKWGGSVSAQTATEANAQVRWPLAGTFTRFMVRYATLVATSVEVSLRINGIATTFVLTADATGVLVSDLSTEVRVAAGDLVTFSYIRTAGAASGFAPLFVLGFEADPPTVNTNVPACGLYSIEGLTASEPAGLVGEDTLDGDGAIVGGMDIETSAVYIGGGAKSIVQRVFVEGTTEGQSVTCILFLDDVEIALGTFTTGIGEKTTNEFSVNRPGYIASVRLIVPVVASRVEITSIEMDVHNPDDVG